MRVGMAYLTLSYRSWGSAVRCFLIRYNKNNEQFIPVFGNYLYDFHLDQCGIGIASGSGPMCLQMISVYRSLGG